MTRRVWVLLALIVGVGVGMILGHALTRDAGFDCEYRDNGSVTWTEVCTREVPAQ